MNSLSSGELVDLFFESFAKISAIIPGLGPRSRPVIGGIFGHGGFVLMSHPAMQAGLDATYYYVAEARSQLVIGFGATKQEALEYARSVLAQTTPVRLQTECARYTAKVEGERAERDRLRREAIERQDNSRHALRVSSIPRRRQRIFDEAKGRCHYCNTALTLDGKWHIEHKMPKALGGGNEPGNLVASCATCNHRKSDTTDIEFKAKLAKESAA